MLGPGRFGQSRNGQAEKKRTNPAPATAKKSRPLKFVGRPRRPHAEIRRRLPGKIGKSNRRTSAANGKKIVEKTGQSGPQRAGTSKNDFERAARRPSQTVPPLRTRRPGPDSPVEDGSLPGRKSTQQGGTAPVPGQGAVGSAGLLPSSQAQGPIPRRHRKQTRTFSRRFWAGGHKTPIAGAAGQTTNTATNHELPTSKKTCQPTSMMERSGGRTPKSVPQSISRSKWGSREGKQVKQVKCQLFPCGRPPWFRGTVALLAGLPATGPSSRSFGRPNTAVL